MSAMGVCAQSIQLKVTRLSMGVLWGRAMLDNMFPADGKMLERLQRGMGWASVKESDGVIDRRLSVPVGRPQPPASLPSQRASHRTTSSPDQVTTCHLHIQNQTAYLTAGTADCPSRRHRRQLRIRPPSSPFMEQLTLLPICPNTSHTTNITTETIATMVQRLRL